MSFFHRFLYDDKSEDAGKKALCKICLKDWKLTRICSSLCFDECPSVCKISDSETSLSPPNQEDNLRRFLIIAASSIITTLFLLTLLILCFKFYLRRRRTIAITRRWSMEEARSWDVDGPSPVIIDHPIWHIRTIGLNPSVISAIKVYKYSKKDGVVEGTDCSVCLSEFEEDETLRLLPKCRHAFHLSCIDTWLRSHTNCPLCRAPIVIIDDSSEGVEEISVVMVPQENGEIERDHEEERDEFVSDLSRDLGHEVANDDDDSHKRVGRSVSLDALSGLRVSEVVLGRDKEKVKRGNNIGSSIVGRSGFLKRSISYSGK